MGEINKTGYLKMLDDASEDIGETKSNNEGEIMEIRYDNTLRDELMNEGEVLPQSEIDALLRAISPKKETLKSLLPVSGIDEDIGNPSLRQRNPYTIPELGIEIELMNADRADKEEKDVSIMGKISRTTDSLHNIKNDTYRDKSDEYRKFNDKWYSEMHHSSLGEHAIIKLWFNGIDIATAKLLEKGIYGISPTERSTRYFIEYANKVDENLEGEELYNVLKELYVINPAFVWEKDNSNKNDYYNYLRKATNTFIEVKEQAQEYIEKIMPNNKAKSKYLDIARQYLLTSSRTSVVITYNAVSLKNVLINLARGSEIQRTLALHLHQMLMGFYPSLFGRLNLDLYMSYEKNVIHRIVYNHAIDDDEFYLKIGKFNPNLGLINKDLCSKELWDKFNPIISSLKPTFKVKQVDIDKNINMNDCLCLMDLYSATKEYSGNDNNYFRGLQYPVRVLAECQIDYGTWRDIQRHRISNNIYNDYNTPLLGMYGVTKDIYEPIYMIPNIEVLDSFDEDRIIEEVYNGSREVYESNKSSLEMILATKLKEMVDSYKNFLSNYAIAMKSYDETLYKKYEKESLTICNNIHMVELSSDMNLLAYRMTAIMNLDLRAIKHIVENRIIPAGHNSYRLFAMSMFENTVHYIMPKLVEKKVLTYQNKDIFVRTLFNHMFAFNHYKNIIDRVKNI